MIRTPLIDVSSNINEVNKKKVRLLSNDDNENQPSVSKLIVFDEEVETTKELKRKSTENKIKLEELMKENQLLIQKCNFLENENKLTKNANKLLVEKEKKNQKELDDLKNQLDHLTTLYKASKEENEIKENKLEIQMEESITSPIHQILIKNKNEEIDALRMSNEILLQQVKPKEFFFLI